MTPIWPLLLVKIRSICEKIFWSTFIGSAANMMVFGHAFSGRNYYGHVTFLKTWLMTSLTIENLNKTSDILSFQKICLMTSSKFRVPPRGSFKKELFSNLRNWTKAGTNVISSSSWQSFIVSYIWPSNHLIRPLLPNRKFKLNTF